MPIKVKNKIIRNAWKQAQKAAPPKKQETFFNQLDSASTSHKVTALPYEMSTLFLINIENEKVLITFNEKLLSPSFYSNIQKDLLNSMACPSPLYIAEGEINRKLFTDVLEDFNQGLEQLITPAFIAVTFNHIFKNSNHINSKCPQIDEAIRAYFIGATTASATLLLTVFESVLRDLGNSLSGKTEKTFQTQKLTKDLLNLFFKSGQIYGFPEFDSTFLTEHELRNLISKQHPAQDLLNAFIIFFEEVLYCHTDANESIPILNRHNYLHLFDSNAQSRTAFHRLILILTYLAWIEALVEHNDKISRMWLPKMTLEDLELSESYIRYGIADLLIKQIDKSPAA